MWWRTGFVTTYDNAEGRWENNSDIDYVDNEVVSVRRYISDTSCGRTNNIVFRGILFISILLQQKGKISMEKNNNIPRMMTVRAIAKTGLLPENTIRVMLKKGQIQAVYSGKKALINYDNLCKYLQNLTVTA